MTYIYKKISMSQIRKDLKIPKGARIANIIFKHPDYNSFLDFESDFSTMKYDKTVNGISFMEGTDSTGEYKIRLGISEQQTLIAALYTVQGFNVQVIHACRPMTDHEQAFYVRSTGMVIH